MMGYCTLADYQARLGDAYRELYRAGGDAAARADIATAEAEINAALSSRYSTPIRGYDALLGYWTSVLAEVVGWVRSPAMSLPDTLKGEAERIRAALAQYAAGALKFGRAAQEPVLDVVEGDHPVFTRPKMRGY